MSVTTLADPMFKQFWKESEEHDDVRCLHEDGATLHSVVRHDRPTAELNEATPNGCLPQENEMKLVACVNNMCNDSIDWKVDPLKLDEGTPLYTAPQKYCPSENNEAYEKGFIDGMQKQMQSSVDKFINGCVCGEPLAPNTVHRKDSPCYVKEDLSDEEIIEVWGVHSIWDDKLIDFARAILKKVSEK